tara:strand:- start:522 stop:674 length:153 start_codon:yes stop_codon:yes gene_type:complete
LVLLVVAVAEQVLILVHRIQEKLEDLVVVEDVIMVLVGQEVVFYIQDQDH